MNPRRRLAVVLLLPEPVATEVQGLRRALEDPALAWVAPHVTLIPPINVRAADVPAAFATLRRACGTADGPLSLALGPATSFLPAEPVVYLAVDGDVDGFARLQRGLVTGPFDRPLHHDPWVPHVTVAISREAERIPAAVDALSGYGAEVDIGWAQVMEQQPDHTWAVLADAPLGPIQVSGRGGLERTVWEHRHLDPEVAAACSWEPGPVAVDEGLVVVREEDRPVGARRGEDEWVDPAEVGTGIQEILDRRFTV